MTVDELLQYLKENGNQLKESIRNGKYNPKAVRRVEIPKADGSKRKLVIPTVVDRVIQQAVAQHYRKISRVGGNNLFLNMNFKFKKIF